MFCSFSSVRVCLRSAKSAHECEVVDIFGDMSSNSVKRGEKEWGGEKNARKTFIRTESNIHGPFVTCQVFLMFTSVHIYSFVFGNRTTERTAKKLLKMFFWLLEFDMTQMGWHAIGNFQKQFQKIQKSVFRLQLRFSSEYEKTNSKQVSVFLSGLLSISFGLFAYLLLGFANV